MEKKEEYYKIVSHVTGYSKRKGAHLKKFTLDKNLSLEEALSKSKKEYGNSNSEMDWRHRGFIYPTQYYIKKQTKKL